MCVSVCVSVCVCVCVNVASVEHGESDYTHIHTHFDEASNRVTALQRLESSMQMKLHLSFLAATHTLSSLSLSLSACVSKCDWTICLGCQTCQCEALVRCALGF